MSHTDRQSGTTVDADLTVLAADPASDIEAFADVVYTIRGGRVGRSSSLCCVGMPSPRACIILQYSTPVPFVRVAHQPRRGLKRRS